MFKRFLSFVLVAAATSLVAAQDLSSADREQLLAIATTGDAAWNARDAEALAQTFTADAQNVILGTPVDLRGRAAIVDYFTKSFAKVDPAMRHRTTVDELTFIASGVAVAGGRVSLVRTNPDGTSTEVKKFTMTAVLVREGTDWKIRVNRVHPEP